MDLSYPRVSYIGLKQNLKQGRKKASNLIGQWNVAKTKTRRWRGSYRTPVIDATFMLQRTHTCNRPRAHEKPSSGVFISNSSLVCVSPVCPSSVCFPSARPAPLHILSPYVPPLYILPYVFHPYILCPYVSPLVICSSSVCVSLVCPLSRISLWTLLYVPLPNAPLLYVPPHVCLCSV